MRRESQGQYIFVIIPGHPMADKRGRVLEHRYMMAEHLGRILTDEEVVHHKNENTRDNRLDNFELLSPSDHTKHHHPAHLEQFQCPQCRRLFSRSTADVKGVLTFCSRSCSIGYYVSRRDRVQHPHGIWASYRSGCRCDLCRAANAARTAEKRAKKRVSGA